MAFAYHPFRGQNGDVELKPTKTPSVPDSSLRYK